ncbi:MAG: hypothetical protein EOP56_19705, partial [Sphingobacteriales bacterium]
MQKNILFSKTIVTLLLLFFYCAPSVKAQVPATAAAYPFTATTEPFVYLTGGTTVALQGDDVTVTGIPIGFSFPFCTGTYTTLSACTNGWASLANSASGTWTNDATNVGTIGPVLFPLFDDQWGSAGSVFSYLTTGSAPNRVFTFEWRALDFPRLTTPNAMTFQLKLYEGGVIKFCYKEEPPTPGGSASGSIGIGRNATDWQTLNNATLTAVPSSTTFTSTISTRPPSDLVYIWGQLPCTGMPTTTVAGPTEVCANRNFTLGLAGLSLYSGFTFTWQKSADGINWTNFTGTINPLSGDITDMLTTAPAYYRCIVKCNNSNLTYTTPAHFINIAPFYYCYCDNQGTFPATVTNKVNIGNVKINTVPADAVRLANQTLTGSI